MANELIRKALRVHDIRQWQLAKEMGIAEVTLCRKLRDELPKSEQRKIADLVRQMAEGQDER